MDNEGAVSGICGGQLWLRRGSASFAFLTEMLKHENDTSVLDQDVAQRVATRIPGLRHKAMPLSFQSKCWYNMPIDGNTTTFHLNCMGNESSKLEGMREARQFRKAIAS